MPRSSNSVYVPKYRKHRASGQAIVTINGRDYYLGPHGTKASQLEHDRIITEWLASGRSSSFGLQSESFTIVELLAAYLPFAKRYYGNGQRGEFANMKRVMKPLARLYGEIPATEFGPQELKAVRQVLITRGLSRTYINATVLRLVRIFRWGVAEGLLSPSVPQALAMVPGLRKGPSEARETEAVRPINTDVVTATLPHLSPVVAAMVQLQLFTGARPGEICKLRVSDVNCTGDVWLAQLKDHKTAHHDQERTIFLGPRAQQVLSPFLARPANAYCFSPIEATNWLLAQRAAQRVTPLSCGNRPGTNRKLKPRRRAGDRYTPASYYYAIRRACERAGIEPWSPGRLRHTTGTDIRHRFGLEASQVFLGHSQVTTTQIYAARDMAKGLEVARCVG